MKIDTIGIAFVEGVHIASLEAFHDHLLDTASGIVAAGKEMAAPMLFVLSNGGKLAIIPAGKLSKDAVAAYQQTVVTHPMVRACAVVFEAWTSHQTAEARRANPDAMPVDDPERGEAIVVSILTAGRQAMTFSRIERPANIVHRARFEWLDEAKNLKNAGGRFVR